MPDAVIQPLEVFVLDADFKRLTGSIPYDSLVWRRRYYGVGEFQMQVRSSLYSTEWAYVYCEDRPETGIIQKVEYDDTTAGPRNGEDTVLVSGFFLEEILNRLVFLVEESETQEIKHVVPKPTRLSVSKPQFKKDADGNIYTIWNNGTINNCMTGEAARVEDSQELIAGLTDADVQPGKGIHEQVFNAGQGDYTVGLYSSNYSYVSDDGKLHVLDARDETQASFDIVGDPSAGLVLYKDDDGSVKWVNGTVESYSDTYRRRTQRWEELQEDEYGNHYWMEYREVEGPWMLRADLDDVTSPQDNVQWVLKMAEKTFQGNFIYDKVDFTGETKTLTPSLSRIGDFFYGELQSVEASLRVLYLFEADQMVFQLWRGLDRTQDGGGQTPVETAALMAASAEPGVPIGYEKLEYIQSTGTQYIRLDFTPDSDTRVVLDHQLMDTQSTQAVLGSRTHLNATDQYGVYIVNGQLRTDYGSARDSSFTASSSRVTLDKDGRTTTYNGKTNTLSAATFTCPRPMVLFSMQNISGTAVFDDQVDNRPVKMRVYSCQIYDGDALARSLVPARRQQDSAVGLYDTVTGTFFGNSGTGTFVAGPVVSIADSLTYDPNGGEGSMDPTPGHVGDAVVVEANGFTRDGHIFRVWNTQADGGGTDYAPLSEYTLTAGADVLYAQWDEVPEPPIPVPEGVGVPWAVFSDTWGTLYGFKASHDTSNYRNKCYVMYDYEEPVWNSGGKRVQVDDDGDGVYDRWTYTNYSTERKRGYWIVRLEDDRPDAEVWLDLRGESPDFMEGVEFGGYVDSPPSLGFTQEDFEKWVEGLKTRGRTLLTSDYGDVDNLDTGTISTMRYLYDFDLGDKVDMAVEAIGMTKTARITEVEEVYESGSAEIHLTMGEELLTTDKKSLLV